MVDVAHARAVVDAALAASAALHAARDALAPAVAAAAGLSVPGALFGFESLERSATDDDVARLAASVTAADEVAVVLSANVFVAALRAVALARVAAPRVRVRPSRREPVFARALVEAWADPAITLEPGLDLAAVRRGVVHVYGRDETIAAIRASARVPVVGHGAGMGVAIVGRGAEVEGAARALARDVVAFDQRGCLSPRIVWVEGDRARARALAAALDEAIAALAIPVGVVDDAERAEARRYLETMRAVGDVVACASHVVAVAEPGAPALVPPAGRNVHVAPFTDPREVAAAMSPYAPFVVAVGGDAALGARLFPRARGLALGSMQRPPLDGPVDLRGARATS